MTIESATAALKRAGIKYRVKKSPFYKKIIHITVKSDGEYRLVSQIERRHVSHLKSYDGNGVGFGGVDWYFT